MAHVATVSGRQMREVGSKGIGEPLNIVLTRHVHTAPKLIIDRPLQRYELVCDKGYMGIPPRPD
eukprot:2953738-Pleurochrysis_carterae.AAC.3